MNRVVKSEKEIEANMITTNKKIEANMSNKPPGLDEPSDASRGSSTEFVNITSDPKAVASTTGAQL